LRVDDLSYSSRKLRTEARRCAGGGLRWLRHGGCRGRSSDQAD